MDINHDLRASVPALFMLKNLSNSRHIAISIVKYVTKRIT